MLIRIMLVRRRVDPNTVSRVDFFSYAIAHTLLTKPDSKFLHLLWCFKPEQEEEIIAMT